ncbi:hypothetical protein [Streptomyces sp. NPDC026659]|uniref:hypothetical protein n=1 Tax=Streptomyces sp. NPDC026659 TaxID=3155123 RepID=UPI0033D21842
MAENSPHGHDQGMGVHARELVVAACRVDWTLQATVTEISRYRNTKRRIRFQAGRKGKLWVLGIGRDPHTVRS